MIFTDTCRASRSQLHERGEGRKFRAEKTPARKTRGGERVQALEYGAGVKGWKEMG